MNLNKLIFTPPYSSDNPEDDLDFDFWCDEMDKKDKEYLLADCPADGYTACDMYPNCSECKLLAF